MRGKGIYAIAMICGLVIGPALTVPAKQADTEKAKIMQKIDRRTRQMNPTSVRHLGYRISGRISAASDGHLIRARRIKIILRKGHETVFTQTKTLDAAGACNYQFMPRFPGDYTLAVQKVATSTPPSSTLNVCFNGTTPASRSVTLDARSRTIGGQDFSIRFFVAFDRHGLCW